jgi:hypothetical protein
MMSRDGRLRLHAHREGASDQGIIYGGGVLFMCPFSIYFLHISMHIHCATSVLLYHHMLWVCCGFFLRLLFEYCLCLFLCEILTHLLPTLSTLVLTFFSSHPQSPISHTAAPCAQSSSVTSLLGQLAHKSASCSTPRAPKALGVGALGGL